MFRSRYYKKEFGPLITARALNNWTIRHFGLAFEEMPFDTAEAAFLIVPISKGYITNKISYDESLLARDPFMLNNIASALNKYDIVFAVFGGGHYLQQRRALKAMMGTPKYITEVERFKRYIPSCEEEQGNEFDITIKDTVLVP